MPITKEARAEAQKKLDGFVARFGKIKQIYVGEDICCRCGCRGRYHEGERINRRTLGYVLRILAETGKCEVLESGPYVNIPHGNNRAVTLYFEGVKNNG